MWAYRKEKHCIQHENRRMVLSCFHPFLNEAPRVGGGSKAPLILANLFINYLLNGMCVPIFYIYHQIPNYIFH